MGGPVLGARRAEAGRRFAGSGRVTVTPGVDLADAGSVDTFYASVPDLWASVNLAGGFAMAPIERSGARDFADMIDAETGRTRVRSVDVSSTRYAIARRYMLRLRREDFADPHDLAKLAATVHLTSDEFRARFEYLTANEPDLRDVVEISAG